MRGDIRASRNSRMCSSVIKFFVFSVAARDSARNSLIGAATGRYGTVNPIKVNGFTAIDDLYPSDFGAAPVVSETLAVSCVTHFDVTGVEASQDRFSSYLVGESRPRDSLTVSDLYMVLSMQSLTASIRTLTIRPTSVAFLEYPATSRAEKALSASPPRPRPCAQTSCSSLTQSVFFVQQYNYQRIQYRVSDSCEERGSCFPWADDEREPHGPRSVCCARNNALLLQLLCWPRTRTSFWCSWMRSSHTRAGQKIGVGPSSPTRVFTRCKTSNFYNILMQNLHISSLTKSSSPHIAIPFGEQRLLHSEHSDAVHFNRSVSHWQSRWSLCVSERIAPCFRHKILKHLNTHILEYVGLRRLCDVF